ncbi:MAG: glycosyl hydrolase [Bacteroidia bacterium]
MKLFRFLLLMSVLISSKSFSQSSNQIDPSWFQSLTYRCVGPLRGGRVTAVTGIPDKPFTFFMGSTGGGVWKTDDAGTTWENISDGQINVGSIGAISIAPSDQNVVYVGTGSACPRGNISPGNGVYKSENGGRDWVHTGLEKAGLIGKIIIHPQEPDIAWVAVLGNIFGPNPERGVYKTMDGGKNWKKVLYIDENTGAIDLDINPSNPRILFAGMWTARRKPWTLIDGGEKGGVYTSSDGGETWKLLDNGLPRGVLGRVGIAISPMNPQRIWVTQQAAEEEQGGLYRSDDGGKTWERINRDHNLRQRGWYYSHIIAHPTDENTVYGLNVGLIRSIDGGKNFSFRLPAPHSDHHALWINPLHPEMMINGNDGGASISLNNGKTWSPQSNQPTAELYRATVDNQFPYRLYAGQQDNTTISVSSWPIGDLHEYQEYFSVGGHESGDVAVDPRDPDIIYAGTYSGEITRMDKTHQHTRQVTSWPHYTEGWEQRNLKYRFQWNFPIRISPHNPDEVYHTSNYVHKSIDGGQTWEVISPDLTRSLDKYHGIPGGPVQHDGTGVEIYSTIFAFEISPYENGVMWAGSDDGLIHITRDHGKTWDNITPENMPDEGTVNMIALSPHDRQTAYIAVYRYRDNDFSPYIFKTSNYGKSWVQLTDGKNGIPAHTWVRAVREDPDRKGLLYAGTEFGMYISFNDGKTWQPFQLNLPVTPITDIEIQNQDLIISTQGRSFWILDDLTPLHHISEANAKKEGFLYPPRPAFRTQLNGSLELPDYPFGGQFHFYFPEEPDTSARVKLWIVDKEGLIFQAWSTHPEEGEKPLRLKKGLNHINWDLRYPGPELVPDFVSMVLGNPAQGPLAPTGNYNLKLEVGEKKYFQSFQIEKDPRWDFISDQDLKLQFSLALEVRQMIEDSHKMIKVLRSMRKQALEKTELAVEAGHNRSLKQAANTFGEKLTALEDKLIQNKVESSQDAINYPRKFSNHIGRLYSVLIGLDSKPTGGVLERFQELKAEYQAFSAEFDDLINRELVDFNLLLQKEKVLPIINE